MGLLDALNDPEMGMAMGLLSAGGPSRMPVSLGQGIAQGYQGYQQAQQMQQQMAARKMQEQMQAMQMQEAQRHALQQQSQEKYISDLVQALPPEQQAIARAFPKEFASTLFKDRQPLFDKINPKDFTPVSLSKFSTTRNYSDLIPHEKEGGAPIIKDFIEGGTVVQKQWNPTGKTWDQVGKGSRWNPNPQTVVNTFNPKELIKYEGDLRKEFDDRPEVKNYKSAYPSYAAIVDSSKRNTPQADINLVYGLAKLYDPTSVVREGEYATIANSASIPDRIKGYAQYLAGGGKFTPEVKAAIVKEADGRIATFEHEAQKAMTGYREIATRNGFNPQNVFTPIGRLNADGTAPQSKSVPSKQITLDDGNKVIATRGADGNYYVTKNGKKYRVEE